MHPVFADPTTSSAIPIHLVTSQSWTRLQEVLDPLLIRFALAQGFSGKAGQEVRLPGERGEIASVLFGLGEGKDALAVAGLSAHLPENTYRVDTAPEDWPFSWIAAGWQDGAYRFDAYLKEKVTPPRLVIPAGTNGEALSREATAIDRLRDMVNTPAEDMGPQAMEDTVRQMAAVHAAKVHVITGDALIAENFPMVHAVGRAGPQAPRLIELNWGDKGAPEIAIVGKGVAFDTGGLNIKTGDFMRLMKKDMGGAAHAIALGDLIMGAKLPVRLRLLVPAVENAISGKAFRPGDILRSRKGLSVEIDNTDAEGRLILADALALASEGEPDLIIDFATLTGAARVALGPDLAPFYTDDEALAGAIETGAAAAGDPAWRMPLWQPYLADLKSPIADLVNSGGRMAGSITAALFLKQFVSAKRWVHLDVWAWRLGKYGRPQGGAACGLRAIWSMVETTYGVEV